MHYTVYIKGLLNEMVPVEVDYHDTMFKLETGEELSHAEIVLLKQLEPDLLDRRFNSDLEEISVDFPVVEKIQFLND